MLMLCTGKVWVDNVSFKAMPKESGKIESIGKISYTSPVVIPTPQVVIYS